MSRIPKEVISHIKKSTNIVDVIGDYLQLKKTGQNFFAHCPFHDDEKPSFCVSPSKQIFTCFSCHRSGNVFTFMMEYRDMSFPQSVRAVAQLDGIAMPKQHFSTKSMSVSKTGRSIAKMNHKAAKLYHHILIDTKAGEKALEYLHKHNISDQTIGEYQLGFAPKENILKTLFTGDKIPADTLKKSGLFAMDKDDKLTDRFSEQVIVPIQNSYSHTVAFIGKAMSKNAHSTITPDTELFSHQRNLFNIDLAKIAIKRHHSAVLMKTVWDVIIAHQANVNNAVALLSVEPNKSQLQALGQYTKHVDVCFTDDRHGQDTACHTLSMLAKSRFTLSAISMPSAPRVYVKEHGGQAFRDYLKDNQESTTTFELRYAERGLKMSDKASVMKYVSQAVQIIAHCQSAVARSIYINQLAKTFGFSVKALDRNVRAFQPINHHPIAVGHTADRSLLRLMLKHPKNHKLDKLAKISHLSVKRQIALEERKLRDAYELQDTAMERQTYEKIMRLTNTEE